MSKDIQQLLQECLDGYDAGLTPEECLMAYPHARNELEPLFRQAISLRVAYAASPRAEFRFQAREKLLFAAGQDVKTALAAEPDQQFVRSTRQRLLNMAGAGAQEALRDVPPPRLPFWSNARRHLLEVAAAAPPKPAPRMSVGMRSALSAAVVVVAVGIAGAGFFLQDSPANQPARSASADLDYVLQQLTAAEKLQASGGAVSASLLDDLATRTSRLAEQYASANPNEDVLAKLPDLIERQQTLLGEEESLNETLAAAQQRLYEADQRVTAAAAIDNVTPEPQPTETPDTTVAIAPTPEPTVEPTAEPTATQEIVIPEVDIVTSEDLEPNQIVKQYEANEGALNIRWWRVTTSNLTFVMPESWQILELDTDEQGLAVLQNDKILLRTDVGGMVLLISNDTGEVTTVANGEQQTLRPAASGTVDLDADFLIEVTGQAENWAGLYNMLDSLNVLIPVEATATPEATVTSTPTTSTATPEVTPDTDEPNP